MCISSAIQDNENERFVLGVDEGRKVGKLSGTEWAFAQFILGIVFSLQEIVENYATIVFLMIHT